MGESVRNISSASLSLIQNKTGLQPINFISVEWVPGVVTYYADRKLNIEGISFEGRILELGNIENIVKVSDNARSQSVSVKLDDTDGQLKNIINNTDIHKKQINVYQWFLGGIPLSEAFIIFQGEINSPILWKEGDRTLSFEIVEKVEDKEIGFSVEEGQFDFVPEEFVGKPFPLGFGTCIRIPVLQINAPPVGLTRHPIGFEDPSLNLKINQNAQKIRNLQESQWLDSLYAGECAMAAFIMEDDVKQLQAYLNGVLTWNQVRAEQAKNKTPQFSQNLTTERVNTGATYTAPGVVSVDGVPEDAFTTHPVALDQSDNIQTFVTGRQEIAQGATGSTEPETIDPTSIQSAISSLQSQISTMRSQQKSFENKAAQEAAQAGQIIADNLRLNDHLTNQKAIGQITSVINGQKFPRGLIRVKINEAELNGSFAGDVFNPIGEIINPNDKRDSSRQPTIDENIEKGKFTIINPGATVKLISNFPIYFIVNLLPSAIHEVLAKRVVNGGAAVLCPIPPQYYTVGYQPFTNISNHTITYNCTVVTLHRGLSTYDEGWEDQIYVTFTSSIGPNIVDILIWLIITYTTHAFDAVQFLDVKSKISQFPANFVLFDRKNILTVLEEITFQARIALWLDNGIFRMKYLADYTGYVDTIIEADIEFGTLELDHTPTEELVTKFVANYRFHTEDKNPNKIILRYNINKYDTIEKSYDFYIFNIPSCVYISAAFWLIRKANTWKRIRFKTPLHKLNLETFDVILLNFSHNFVVDGAVVGIIESTKYDSANWSIEFEVWVPVRLGEMKQYDFAFPSGISPFFVFPTNEEVTDGSVGVDPNSVTTGTLPGVTNFGGWSAITVDNTPTDSPRIRNQDRPRDFGPKNISDDRNGQQHQIPEVQSGTVQTTPVNPGVVRVIQNPDVPDHKVGDIVNIGSNPANSISGIRVMGHIGLGKVVEMVMSSPLPVPPTEGTPVLKDIQRAEGVESSISDDQPYTYRNYLLPKDVTDPPNLIPPTIASAAVGGGIPGIIVSGTGDTYQVRIYPKGLSSASQVVSAKQLQIDLAETIPAGSWTIVTKVGNSYYMQIAVWL